MGSFLQTLQKLGPVRLGVIAATLVVVLGFFIFVATRLTSPSMGLLYGDLDTKDSAQVVAKLDQMNVPYELKGDGTSILVPQDQVARLRLAMAETGIPHGASIGYEVFDKPEGLGTTNFVQGINEMRALEGELERTIGTISVIESARVHLVLPKRELFTRDRQEPSASIVLKIRGNTTLAKGQVAAIQNLVATAVSGLKPNHISIIDQNGNLLARGTDDPNAAFDGNTTSEEQRVAYENRLARSVEEMLDRSIGYGHVRVDVNADMDFDKVTTNQESYDPDGQVVRSTQTVTEANQDNDAGDQAVSVQTNLPDGQQAQGGAGSGTRSKHNRNEETTNYEISKKVTSQTREAGVVKRLSVAVLVDGTYKPGENGARDYQARSPDELAQITKLVQSAIGYNEKRGDKVDVVNMRFAAPEDETAEPPAIFLGLNKADLFRASETLVLAIVAVLVILLVVRPLVTRALETARETALAQQRALAEQTMGGAEALAGPMGMGALPGPGGVGTGLVPAEEMEESMIDISQVEGRVRASSMKKIGEIVEKHPEEAVAIIRSWMYQAT
ncbi:flagellar M-ring protein [Aliidongia dinghuensis]|uniref:Flagellar M-ring protein n=1 Tax=Aliidongia dinghuensis TaxID=1867774 RepID=A0A8J3E5Y0_9PROT|nr:flagellar basal-body MS-ring/collar protein FliF [Aliidongia dinghuensis]GGF39066.1 flagellar M-ring protein [Aliidongia dinghuensis]